MIKVKHFVAPPFNIKNKTNIEYKHKYRWWSWNPQYPYWSRSCWVADSIDEAYKILDKPIASSMFYYHNKLIREGDGNFIEVADLPFSIEKLKELNN